MSTKVAVEVPPDERQLQRPIRQLVKAVLKAEGASGSICVAFVDEGDMKDLNERFRGMDEPTDVLSFGPDDRKTDWPDPTGEESSALGELIVCLPVVRRYALEEGGDPETQLGWTLIHGVLHLLGHDHESDDGEMRSLEQALLSGLAREVRAVCRAVEG